MAIRMFIEKKNDDSLVRLNYKPKIKKSQIEKIIGKNWEHKRLRKKEIKDLGLEFLLDIFGSNTYYCLYQTLKSFYSEYCLGCFDINDKMILYNRIYFPTQKKFEKILTLNKNKKRFDFYSLDSSSLSLLGMDYLKIFKDNYYFKIFRFKLLKPARFTIEVYSSSKKDSEWILCQFDFDMDFDEIEKLINLDEIEKKDKIFYGGYPISNENLYLFSAQHLLLVNKGNIECFLVQNFK